MENLLTTPLGTASILMMIIGFVLTITGIILLIGSQNKPKGWYLWFLLILGIAMLVIGSILLVVLLSRKRNNITKKE